MDVKPEPSQLPVQPQQPDPDQPTTDNSNVNSQVEANPVSTSSVQVTPEPLPPAAPEPTKHSHEGLKSIISTLAIIILAPLVAFCLTAFVFQSYEVDGSSMETTLQNQDRLIVVKVPRTWAKITGHNYIPHRGDVIIFDKSNLFGEFDSQKKQLVKRVIGLPGDHVVVKNGVVTVYNSQYPKGFDPDKTLTYGQAIPFTPLNVDLTVPPGQLFVCGDNRPNSLDSRSFGTIQSKDVIGKLVARIFPFNKLKIF